MTKQPSKQAIYNQRAARALRVLRSIAKDFGYSVGSRGGSEIDDFMDDVEGGKVVVVQAHVVRLEPHNSYWRGESESAEEE